MARRACGIAPELPAVAQRQNFVTRLLIDAVSKTITDRSLIKQVLTNQWWMNGRGSEEGS